MLRWCWSCYYPKLIKSLKNEEGTHIGRQRQLNRWGGSRAQCNGRPSSQSEQLAWKFRHAHKASRPPGVSAGRILGSSVKSWQLVSTSSVPVTWLHRSLPITLVCRRRNWGLRRLCNLLKVMQLRKSWIWPVNPAQDLNYVPSMQNRALWHFCHLWYQCHQHKSRIMSK